MMRYSVWDRYIKNQPNFDSILLMYLAVLPGVYDTSKRLGTFNLACMYQRKFRFAAWGLSLIHI